MSNHKSLEHFDGGAVGKNFLAQLHSSVFGATDFSQISKWLIENTKDPKYPKRPFSFHEHEYQIDILNSTEHEEFYQKCSQVGASELFVRMMAAMLGISEAITIIYVLPTAKFAMRFCKGRIDPVIEGSASLKALLNKDVNSSEMKQFGHSFLYIAGSYGQSSAISIPAQVLFWDEVDFCDQQNLTTYRSRMGHVKEDDLWFIRGFSTPTVFDYGINAYYKKGSQGFYGVYCHQCRDFVEVQFMRDLVVPGFEQEMKEWGKECLDDPSIDIDKSFFRCNCCQNPIPWKNFLDPQKRKWLHNFPERRIRSRQISPFDVPQINPPSRTLRHVDDYEVTADWVNFKVGVPHEDASSSFLVESVAWNQGYGLEPPLTHRELHDVVMQKGLENNLEAFMEWLVEQPQIASGCSMGMDVGKLSWITVLGLNGNNRQLIHAERVQSQSGKLNYRFLYIFHTYGCLMGVPDAGPDFTLSQGLVRAMPGHIWACYYAQAKEGQLKRLVLNEQEGIVTALRTRSFDQFVAAFNGGRFQIAKLREEQAIKSHLKAVKRVSVMKDEGEKGNVEKAKWVSTDDDHFAHSLIYANIAADLIFSQDGYEAHNRAQGGSGTVGVLPSVGKVRIAR